jgi:hypothetical protein
MSHLRKTLAGSAIALFFTFGALAVSLAYDTTPGPLFAAEFQYLAAAGIGPHYTGPVATNLQLESPYLREPPDRPSFDVDQRRSVQLVELRKPLHAARSGPAKVSLQILKSALLI